MDTPFATTDWQPTRPPEPEDVDLTDRLPTLITTLAAQTKTLYAHPYDPHSWLHRAKTLTELRYPELAVGDAHKALLLCRTLLSRLGEGEGRWELGHRMGFWMMRDEDCEGGGEVLEDGVGGVSGDEKAGEQERRITDLQSEAWRVEVGNLCKFPEAEEGRFSPRRYPWMRAEHRVRGDALLAVLNEEFAARTGRRGRRSALCEVRRHAFGKSGTDGRDSRDILGVFVTQDLPDGTFLMLDRSKTWGCIGPGPGGSVVNLRGGDGCANPLHLNMASDDAADDLRWVRGRAGVYAADIITLCRFLLCCKKDGVAHPLDHPLIARLTPLYRRQKVRLFSLEADFAIPVAWLQHLGIDVFADPNYDTWVLFEIKARENNNSWSDPLHHCVSPLFSLFNHSCEPNVTWNTGKDCVTLGIALQKDVKAGEQLFVFYDQYVEDQSLEKRRDRMWRWLEDDCRCSRCVREAAIEVARSSAVRDGGVGGSGSGGGDEKGSLDWDTAEKPVFPEDSW
ncbi:hypothetical protein B0A54_13055 [Friedmanniomyces endolithicus]|uniref:SET domain-containing protein n=1 Tax=Friedmanniomyces endolithicus TaxID=329885 RepID=A0A4U0UMG2_9PEZI|nr:hypothetical protein LTS09_010557 [Friedmanniomyces endolithicus]TKA36116.1 hypothetical protein B0A54_13055 [Friedmanniomyces endolithicus]